MTQRDQRRPGIALGQVDRSPGVRRRGSHHPALPGLGELLQLPSPAARGLPIAHGQHDLDVGRQQARALCRRGGLAQQAADRGRRRVAVALGQPQQRQPG
ncbi:MAG: hypothetical protein ACRDM7_11370, partial [Thermoleophilaceae bacterium]